MFVEINNKNINTRYISCMKKSVEEINNETKYIINYTLINGAVINEEFNSESDMNNKFDEVLNSGGGGGGEINVQTSKTVTLQENGEFTIKPDDGYDAIKKVNVNISVPMLEFEEGTYTPSDDTQEPTINFTNPHLDYPIYFVISDCGDSTNPVPIDSVKMWSYSYYADMTGETYQARSSGQPSVNYGFIFGALTHATNVGTSSMINVPLSYDKNNTSYTEQGKKNAARNYLGDNCIYPKVVSSSSTAPTQVYKADRTYKWFAIWK